MKWIEEVKETLTFAHKAFMTCEGLYCADAEARIEKTLTAIPDEDPMVKLLKWLDGSHALFGRYEALRDIRIAAATINDVIRYIEDELGYRLKEEMKDELD